MIENDDRSVAYGVLFVSVAYLDNQNRPYWSRKTIVKVLVLQDNCILIILESNLGHLNINFYLISLLL